MNTRLLFLLPALFAGRIYSQEAVPRTAASETPVFRVLEESTVRKPDGGTVTFKRVEPPVFAPKVAVEPVLSAAELAEAQRRAGKQQRRLNISASVQKNGLTVLRWAGLGGQDRLEGLSNVDFRLLAGTGGFETESVYYSMFMGVGVDEQALTTEQVALAKLLPADGKPAFVMPARLTPLTAADAQAVAGMKALHDYLEAHLAELVQQHAVRETERAQRAVAERNAPPPAPTNTVIHFWPIKRGHEAGNSKRKGGVK